MPARVVIEVGTHSAWVQEIIAGCGHEVLVANRRLMEGSKRRKRKNNRNRCQQTGPVGSSGFAVVAPDQAPQSGGTPGPGTLQLMLPTGIPKTAASGLHLLAAGHPPRLSSVSLRWVPHGRNARLEAERIATPY